MKVMLKNPLIADLNHVLNYSSDVLDALKGERIFITGGTGFFGSWLLESLLWANQRLSLNLRIVVLTRDIEGFAKKKPHLANSDRVEFIVGDVRNFTFPVGSFSHIIHAATAASAKLNADNPQLMFDTIVKGTERVLEFAQQCNAKKMLFTSSGAVYGKQPPHITHITEDCLEKTQSIEPHSVYGEAKLKAEELCKINTAGNDCEIKIARCFAFVGPYLPLDTHFAIGNFILNGLQGDVINIAGDGTSYRSYLYAADLLIWLWHILIKGKSSYPYNVGSEEAISISDLAHTVAMQFDPRPVVHMAKQPTPNFLPERYVPSTERARIELGLVQRINLSDAINRTKKWHEEIR